MLRTQERFDGIDFLRGLASLAVCWYHFTNSDPAFLSEGVLKLSGKYGWLGVEVFFVISGFIIPYALHRGGYRLKNYSTFLLKRVTRLDPPYLVSIVVSILLICLSLYFGPKEHDPRLNIVGLLLHLGYLNMFFNYPWVNEVYWTLAIEFQYYLLMGLAFPLVVSGRKAIRLSTFALFGLLALMVTSGTFIFHWMFLFFVGITAFQYRVGIIGLREHVLLLLLSLCGTLFTLGVPHALAGLGAFCVISFLNPKNTVFGFFGNISYSLYLLHASVGGSFVVASRQLGFTQSDAGKVVTILIAVCASVSSAYLLYRLVERPSQRWSSSFRYKRDAERELIADGASGLAGGAPEEDPLFPGKPAAIRADSL